MDILSIPIVYNLRFLVAGDQQKTKDFIKKNYKKYKCKNVLDLGCGTGDFASIFSKNEYLGIDLSQKYIDFAKSKYPHQFISADITKHKFSNKKYDAIIFISTLHHLSKKQVDKIMTEAVKMTKRIIIIVDLNPETSPIKKFLIDMDRGEFVRTTEEKRKILEPYGTILKMEHFSTRLASQTGIVLEPKKKK